MDTSHRSHWHRPLKIAMLVPPWYELPPDGYGGLERVCADLVDALVARGHDVTLFGAGTKTGTAAKFVSTTPELQNERLQQTLPDLAHIARVNRLLNESDFDVVHDHTIAGLFTAPQRSVPTVATVHTIPCGEFADILAGVDRSVGLVAISYAQRRLNADLPWTATVYHGLAVNGPSKSEPGTGPVLWLARFNSDKGPDLAIEACQKAGLPLVLAGKCQEQVEKQYFDEVIKPMLTDDVEVLMNPKRQRCEELLLDAPCLLLPIRWEEPFGMVFVEAMATGTPVVALNRGSVPEVVCHGRTGLICDEPDELPEALHEVCALNPQDCVEHVRNAFSPDMMARGYEQVYRHWASAGASGPARRRLAAPEAPDAPGPA
jgi:glycosyltransferase involved in cell wall biosynthesis